MGACRGRALLAAVVCPRVWRHTPSRRTRFLSSGDCRRLRLRRRHARALRRHARAGRVGIPPSALGGGHAGTRVVSGGGGRRRARHRHRLFLRRRTARQAGQRRHGLPHALSYHRGRRRGGYAARDDGGIRASRRNAGKRKRDDAGRTKTAMKLFTRCTSKDLGDHIENIYSAVNARRFINERSADVRCAYIRGRHHGALLYRETLIGLREIHRHGHILQIGRRLELEFAGEALHDGHQYLHLPVVDLAGELRLRHHSHVLLKGRHRAVVEIRRGEGDVAQRGHAPLAGVRPRADVLVVAEVRLEIDLLVVAARARREPWIEGMARRHIGRTGQRRTFVAAHAAEILELLHAGHRFARERGLIAAQVLIERTVRRDEGAFVRGDGLCDVVQGDGITAAEHLIELLAITRYLAYAFRGGLLMRHAHLDGIQNRTLRLLFQRRRAAVPKLRAQYGGVPDRRGRTPADLALDAHRNRSAVRAVAGNVVTGVTGHGAIDRQARVEKQLFSQCDLGGRGGIVGRRGCHLR